MAKFEFEYTEINGLLYPNIEINGKVEIDNLGKYGLLRLNYLHEQKPQMYRKLLLTGKLAEHCTAMDKTAFEVYSIRVSENTSYAYGRCNGTYAIIRTGTRDCR